MTNLPETELDVTSAPFAGLQDFFGFVPSLFRAQALLPRVIEAEVGIVHAILLNHQALSRNQKLSILLAVAAAHRNTYCVTACYGMLLHLLGVTERQRDEIIDTRQADQPVSDTTLINFALKLAANAPRLLGRDIIALREHGFKDEAILEAILVTALSNLFCTLSIGLDPTPDFEIRAIPNQNTSISNERLYVNNISGPYLRQAELNPARFPPFAFLLQRFGFIPNIFRAQTLRPDVIEAETDLVRTVLVPERFLSHAQKECIFLVGLATSLSTGCVATHRTTLRATELSAEKPEQIAVDHHGTDLSAANKALLDFTLKLSVRPSEFRRDDINNLRHHGFVERQILEAVVATALNSFLIHCNWVSARPRTLKPSAYLGRGIRIFPSTARILPATNQLTLTPR